METKVDKISEGKKSQAVANSLPKLESNNEQTLQLVDNRSETDEQRKLQDIANDTPQVLQLKAFQEMGNSSLDIKQNVQLQLMADHSIGQQEESLAGKTLVDKFEPIQKKENNTGLPDQLKTGIENLSGYSMDHVKVHYHSDKPAQLNAYAYAQGTDIHLASGQEKHLPHEAWHVVQQMQGRVQPTLQMKGKVNINDDDGLEKEADVMGQLALQKADDITSNSTIVQRISANPVIQAKIGPLGNGKLVIDRSLKVYLAKMSANGNYDLYDESGINFKRFGISPDDEGYNLYTPDAAEDVHDDADDEFDDFDEGDDDAAEAHVPIDRSREPVATCSFNYRYHSNRGGGALKYDPVNCSSSASMNIEAIERLRHARGGNADPRFIYETILEPRCEDYSRKIMAVPSIGCPEFLKNLNAVRHLQWATFAKDRPTVLFVPLSELGTYASEIGVILKIVGVGLVGWSSEVGLVGFGASRLAAQQYALSGGGARREVVLCDVNTVASDDVAEGYDTGSEDNGEDRSIKAVMGDGKYSAAGFGTGIPRFDYDAEEDELSKTKAAQGGATRPIEQVVIVGELMLYDPSFITSSEDADLTNALLAQETRLHEEDIDSTSFKYSKRVEDEDDAMTDKPQFYNVPIEKVAMDSRSLSKGAYMSQRDHWLVRLKSEDDILIKYRQSKKKKMVERVVSIGQLAKEIADQHRLDQKVIRSLIVEKLILEAKQRQRSQGSGSAVAGPRRGRGVTSSRQQLGEEASLLLKNALHESVMSEAERFGADQFYEIGIADGTDRNCTIISIFKSADVDITREQAQEYRARLGIPPGGDIDLTPGIAVQILNFVSEHTGGNYTLYVVHEGVPNNNGEPQHDVTKHADNGGVSPLFIFFAGTHFSPAWQQYK